VDADDLRIPDPALVVLIGPSGSGKSAWAASRYLPREIVSSDQLRGVVGSGEHDLDASADAFSLLDQIVAARTARRLAVVVDTLGLDQDRRLQYLGLARRSGLPAVAVLFDTDPQLCRERNRARDVPVPAAVLTAQLRKMAGLADQVSAEGWDLLVRVTGAADTAPAGDPLRARPTQAGLAGLAGPAAVGPGARGDAAPPEFILQISSFGWDSDPAGWLRSMALAAAEAGFSGIALMDHLIQIPQVGRAWDPIPEPWVTLGMLAGLEPNLRLGTLVTPVTYRPAGILAKTAATLDALSNGRASISRAWAFSAASIWRSCLRRSSV
jgi:predicted kinase